MKLIPCLLTALACSLSLAQSQSSFRVNLEPEGGAGRTGTGSGTLTLNGGSLSLSNVVWSGISGTYTASHIHGPAAPGGLAGVVYDLGPYHNLNPGNQSGAYNGVITLVPRAPRVASPALQATPRVRVFAEDLS